MKEEFEKITKFTPAFYKIHENPAQNYGVGCVKCYMVLKGKKGAVHFIFGTGMHLPKTYKYWSTYLKLEHRKEEYMGYDVGYHSPTPQYEGQYSHEKCEWLNSKTCYGDGSALMADEWMKIFVAEGSDKIWEMLEEYYKERFN